MTYTVLDKPPTGRKWRIGPQDRPSFIDPDTDEVNWWSNGKVFYLHIATTTTRTSRNKPSQDYVHLKETRDHWYEVTK